MRFDEDPKDKPESRADEEKTEETFSFLQETIKPEPMTRKKLFEQFARLAVRGIILGIFACLAFYALKPWVQNMGSPETVTIPEDAEEEEKAAELQKEEAEAEAVPDIEDYEAMMRSVGEVAKEVRKCIADVYARPGGEDWKSDGNRERTGCTGLIAADNGRELLIFSSNDVCADASAWDVIFSDGRTYQAELKKQDKNTGFAVFGVKRSALASATWEGVKVAQLGNSNIVSVGETVIGLGELFGYSDGRGYGIVSSKSQEKVTADHTFGVIATDIAASESGTGVLYNLDGEVIGMIDAAVLPKEQSSTVNAYAISDLKSIMELLLNGEEIPYVGINSVTIDEETAEGQGLPRGVYVTQVQADSPAMAAGIQAGDVLQTVDGISVSTTASYEAAVESSETGETIVVKGKRLGAGGYVDVSFEVAVGSKE